MMDLITFQNKADIYGGDLSRWPKELLPAAIATLKQTPEANQILEDVLAFDAQFSALPTPPISAAFRAKLLAIPEQQTSPTMMRWLMTPTRLAVSVALFGILGLSVGVNDTSELLRQETGDSSAWVFAPDQNTENDYAMLD